MVISLLKDTELVSDRAQGFWYRVPSATLQYLNMLINLFVPPLSPAGPFHSPCSPALCPGLPHWDPLALWALVGFGQWQAPAGEWRAGDESSCGLSSPSSLCSGLCFLAVAVFLHNYSFCQEVLLPGNLLTGLLAPCSFSLPPQVQGDTGSPLLLVLGASWSPVNPACTAVEVPSSIHLSEIVFHQETDAHLCLYTWIKSEDEVSFVFLFFNGKCFFYIILHHTSKYSLKILKICLPGYIQMVNEHMRYTQFNQSSRKYKLQLLSEWLKLKTQIMPSIGEEVEQLELFIHCWWECKLTQPRLENGLTISNKAEHIHFL